MKTMQFRSTIKAPVDRVYETMIGKDTFKQWASEFNPTSDFEGGGENADWERGSKIYFVGLNHEGKREGMVGYVREHAPARYISVEYVGILDGDNELTEGPVAEEWKGFENYTFVDREGTTELIVDLDVNDEMINYFGETYPRALNRLKALCEDSH